MKVNLIGMILNNLGRRTFEGLVSDDDGKPLSAADSLHTLMLEYAHVAQGGTSKLVTASREVLVPPRAKTPKTTGTACAPVVSEERLKDLARLAAQGETGRREYSVDVSWLVEFAGLVAQEVGSESETRRAEIDRLQQQQETLAMMLRRCAHRLRNHGQGDLSDDVIGLLRRCGLQGSVLRQEDAQSAEGAARPNKCGLTECAARPMCPRCQRWEDRAYEQAFLGDTQGDQGAGR